MRVGTLLKSPVASLQGQHQGRRILYYTGEKFKNVLRVNMRVTCKKNCLIPDTELTVTQLVPHPLCLCVL